MCDIGNYKDPPEYDPNWGESFTTALQAWVQFVYDNKTCKWGHEKIIDYLVTRYGYDRNMLSCICTPKPPYRLYTDCNNSANIKVCQNSLAPKCWDERAWSPDCIDDMNTWMTAAQKDGMSIDDIFDYIKDADTSHVFSCICDPSSDPPCDKSKADGCRYTYPYRSMNEDIGNVYITTSQPVGVCSCDPDCPSNPTGYAHCGKTTIETPSDCANDACRKEMVGVTRVLSNQDCTYGHRDSCESLYNYENTTCSPCTNNGCPKIGDVQGTPVGIIGLYNDGQGSVPLVCSYPGTDLINSQQALKDLYVNYLQDHPEELANPIWSKILANYCMNNIHPDHTECQYSFGTDKNGNKLCMPIQADPTKDGGKQCTEWYTAISDYKTNPNYKDIFAPFTEKLFNFCRQEDTFYDPNTNNDPNYSGPLGIWASDQCSCINAQIDKDDTINQKFHNEYTLLYQDIHSAGLDKTNQVECWLEPCRPTGGGMDSALLINPLYYQSINTECKMITDKNCCPKVPDCENILINDGTIDATTIKSIKCNGDTGSINQQLSVCGNNVCASQSVPIDTIKKLVTYPNLNECAKKCFPPGPPGPPSPPGPASPRPDGNAALKIVFYILLVAVVIIVSYVSYRVIKYRKIVGGLKKSYLYIP